MELSSLTHQELTTVQFCFVDFLHPHSMPNLKLVCRMRQIRTKLKQCYVKIVEWKTYREHVIAFINDHMA